PARSSSSAACRATPAARWSRHAWGRPAGTDPAGRPRPGHGSGPRRLPSAPPRPDPVRRWLPGRLERLRRGVHVLGLQRLGGGVHVLRAGLAVRELVPGRRARLGAAGGGPGLVLAVLLGAPGLPPPRVW